MKKANIMKEDIEIETRSRSIRHPKRKQVGFRSPEVVREPNLANKCDVCSFMTPSKERFYIHIKQHKEGFKCDHCEDTCISKHILKENIFNVHKNKTIVPFS